MTDEGFSLDREILNYLSENPGESANMVTNWMKLEHGRFTVGYIRERINGLINAGKLHTEINKRAPTQAPLLFVAESKPAKVEGVEGGAVPNASRYPWTKKDEKYLKDHFGFDSPADIGSALGRSTVAINTKICEMLDAGMLKRHLPGHIDTKRVAKMLGVGDDYVAYLVRSGSLPAKRMVWGGGYGRFFFLKSDVEAFEQTRLAKKPIKPTTQKQATLDTPAPVVKTPPAIIGSPRDSIEGETPAAYAAFCVYLDAPAGEQKARDIAQKLYGTATPTQVQRMRHWASDHHWAERAKAWIARKAEVEQIVNIPSHKATAADFPVKSRSKPEIVELKPKPATVPEKLKPEIREIIRPAKRYGPWTHEEDAVVLDKYRTMTAEMISEIIDRTPSAITGRIWHLRHVQKSREFNDLLRSAGIPSPGQVTYVVGTVEEPIRIVDEAIKEPEEPIPEAVEELPEPVIEPAVICLPPVAEPKSGWWGKISKIKDILINGVKL